MAEQWPFKPLVESSNLSALTILSAADKAAFDLSNNFKSAMLQSSPEIAEQSPDQNAYQSVHEYMQLPLILARPVYKVDLK